MDYNGLQTEGTEEQYVNKEYLDDNVKGNLSE